MSDLHKLKGLEGKRQEPLKRKKGFKLQCLPWLARNEVIRSMDIKEIIKISLCSRRMERMIRYAQVKVNKIEFYINMSNSTLGIESLNKTINPCGPHQLRDGSSNFRSRILSQWINKYSSFQNCLSIFKHLQKILSFNSLCLDVNFNGMTVEYFKEILTEPALKDFGFLYIDQGEIDAGSLDLVMEMAKSNRYLHINNTRVPENYHHENAFKFYVCNYWDARWVCIEELLTLKNNETVHLSWHNLTYSDMNTYIKYWIDSDHDMVRMMTLYTEEGIQPESLFDGIVVLKHPGIQRATYLVAANRTKQRKYQLMAVFWFDDKIHFYSKDVSDENVDDKSWLIEYKVLLTLNMKKELEGKSEEIQKLLETNQDQKLVERKNEISRELQNVSQELAGYNLVLRDGVYCYEFFKQILTEPALKNFDRLCIENGEIGAEFLDLVMEMANSDRDLDITSKTKFPHNYYHDNAFKFRHIFYSDARPVRIEHLFSLKDVYSITLDTHRLTRSDLNKFIKFWIDSDHDMVDLLDLKMWVSEPQIFFNGIVVLVGQRMGLAFHLIAANPKKQRERQIMAVIWSADRIYMYSWDNDQPILFGNTAAEPWAREYEVLMAMNKEKELKGELEKVDTIAKKNEITRELQNVSQELDGYNLVFRNGFYHYKTEHISAVRPR